jgi:hypothetical protein
MVNKVEFPQTTLPTFVSFSHFYTFWDESLGMIWDSNSSIMEEPHVCE